MADPLDLFPGITIQDAWKYDRDQIFTYLKTNATGDNAELLDKIRTEIIDLSLPEGGNYLYPEPKQHIYRTMDVETPAPAVFTVKKHIHRFEPEHIYFPYWSPYDLLGLFLSLICTPQPAATKVNTYLPWTAVYGRWCSKIGTGPDNSNGGVFFYPVIFQCTWFKRDGESGKFFLGASFGGIDQSNPGDEWERRVKEERFRVLWEGFAPLRSDLDKDRNNWTFDTSPQREVGKKTYFGSCGETYPFLNMFRESGELLDDEKNNLFGLALDNSILDLDPSLTEWPGTNFMWKKQRGPCSNCKKLINLWKGEIPQFGIKFGEAYSIWRGVGKFC